MNSKKFKHVKYLVFTFLAFPAIIFGQVLTINSGSSIGITPSSSIFLDGLEIAPDVTYEILGTNTVSRTATPVTSNGNSSISRVYNTISLLSGFTGTLNFSYTDEELNNIDESNLVLELQSEDNTWTSYTPIVDTINNTLSYSFSEVLAFKAVTASSASANLKIEVVGIDFEKVRVYPNPTADKVFISSEMPQRIVLFDILGKKILTTQQNQLDLNNLGVGTYILKAIDDTNNTSTFKIIKQ